MDHNSYKAKVAAVFDEAAARYDQLGVEFFTPMGRRLVDRVAPRPGERVLDVGCGRGACLFPAAERVGAGGRALGVDIAPTMVALAREQARLRRMAQVEARVLDAERPGLPPRSFDVVLGSYSLIFLPDAPSALGRYAQLLADGGRIGFTSPVFDDDAFPFLPPVFTDLIPRSLLRELPDEWQPERLRERFNSWLARVEDLDRVTRSAGFADVHVVDENVDLVAPSGAVWVDWSHTQGMALLWRHLPPAQATELRQRLTSSLDAMRDGDGPLVIPTPVRFVTAVVAR